MSKINYKYNPGDIVYFIYEDKPYVGEIDSITIYGKPNVVRYKIKIRKKVKSYNSVYDTDYIDIREEYIFNTKGELIQYLTKSIDNLDWFNN